MSRSPLAFLALATLVAGCLAPFTATTEPASTDLAEAELPPGPWKPNPKIGPQPVLRADTQFVETEWGFVKREWEPPAEARPLVFAMDGYAGAGWVGGPTHYLRVRDGTYIGIGVGEHPDQPGWMLAYASIRGTGCSGGALNLFDRTSSYDGHEAIEFLATENWTGPIGMSGASYSALTAALVASTQPPSLGAIAISAAPSDIYRDAVAIGGVPNDVFPVLWPFALRPSLELPATLNTLAGADEVCAFNIALREPTPAGDQPALLLTQQEDGPIYQSRSPITYARDIRVPTLMTVAWQDEQLSARMVQLFRAIPDDVPKRLEATNGWHFTSHSLRDAVDLAWYEEVLLGNASGLLAGPPVNLHFGATRDPYEDLGTIPMDDFPSSTTRWTRLHLREGGALSPEPAAGDEAPDMYVAAPRQNWVIDTSVYAPTPAIRPDTRGDAGPDVLVYRTEPFDAPVVVAGPVAATLFVSSTAPDTDLYVSVDDVYPDGSVSPVSRGALRASHRALDERLAWRNAAGELTRPYHPHTNPEPITPGEVVAYEIEVIPFAHVLQPGHSLQLRVHGAALADGMWGYHPTRQGAVNTLYHDEARGSSILLPILPWAGPMPEEFPCGGADGYYCRAGAAAATAAERAVLAGVRV